MDDEVPGPLGYPGRPPETSGLLLDDRFIALPGGALDDALRSRGKAVLEERRPVLAVGANASPARLRAKLTGRAPVAVPMTYATVRGLAPGVSAHVSRPGNVPAAPMPASGVTCELIVVWLDDEQLAIVDATEPNYRRVAPPDTATVSLAARPLACELYAGRHGYLVDAGGAPFTMTGQAELLAALLADLPALADLVGTRSPEEFVSRTRDAPGLRDQVRELWRGEGRTRHWNGTPAQ